MTPKSTLLKLEPRNQKNQDGNFKARTATIFILLKWSFFNFRVPHPPSDPLECVICRHKSLNLDALEIHKAQHPKCDVCLLTFKTNVGYRLHLLSPIHELGQKTRRYSKLANFIICILSPIYLIYVELPLMDMVTTSNVQNATKRLSPWQNHGITYIRRTLVTLNVNILSNLIFLQTHWNASYVDTKPWTRRNWHCTNPIIPIWNVTFVW